MVWQIMHDWVNAFWFFLPAGISNMAPVFAKRLPILRNWDAPLDFGKLWRKKRIFDDNKTIRGVVVGTLVAVLVSWLIFNVSYQSYSSSEFILGGAAMGLGALLGDALESFLKRRRGIKAGDGWFPFDQTDYIVGGLLLSYPLLHPNAKTILLVFVIYFGLHLIVSYIGYLLKLKQKPI